MHDFIVLMWKPLLACVVLAGIHSYLGIHVLERKVVFVDLALAQIAALGAASGALIGLNLHGPGVYWLSLASALVGAAVLSLTRMRNEKIPQEAVIGVIYAVAAAATILVLSHSPEGDEHIRFMLVGNILLVNFSEILKMIVLYGLLGILLWRFQDKFILISTQPDNAYRKGISVRLWDFFFYLIFGAVVSSSVHIAGVLLVFSFLIIPAVCAVMISSNLQVRVWLGWGIGVLASLVGMILSYLGDLPTGATVVCAFGAVFLAVSLLWHKLVRKQIFH